MKYRPTKEDKQIIRRCAERSAGYGRVELCPGTRYNTEQDRGEHMNIAMVSSHPDWDDTDLASNAWTWNDFTKGVELTEDGRGIFDFYVYGPLNYDKELQTNVVAYYEGGKLVRVTGTCDGNLYVAGESK
jgi:hypothetical protein